MRARLLACARWFRAPLWQQIDARHVALLGVLVYAGACVRFVLHRSDSRYFVPALVVAVLGIFLNAGEAVLEEARLYFSAGDWRAAKAFVVMANIPLISTLYYFTQTLESDFFLFFNLPILGAVVHLEARARRFAIAATCAALLFSVAGLWWTAALRLQVHHAFLSVALPREMFIFFVALIGSQLRRARAAQSDLREALAEIVPATASAANLDRELDALLDAVIALGFHCAAIGLVDDHIRTIALVRGRGISPEQVRMCRYSLDDPTKPEDIMVHVVKNRTHEIFPADKYDPRFNRLVYEKFEQQALARVFVPLFVETVDQEPRVIGTLECGFTGTHASAFVQDNWPKVEPFARDAARRIDPLRTHVVLTRVAEHARKLVAANGAIIQVLRGDEPIYQAAAGEPQASRLFGYFQKLLGFGRQSIDRRSGVLAGEDDLSRDHPKLYAEGICSLGAFPLLDLWDPDAQLRGAPPQVASTRAIRGVLYVYFRQRRALTEHEIEIERVFAQEIGALIQNYLHQREQAETIIRLQHEVVELSSEFRLKEVTRKILAQFKTYVPFQIASVQLIQGDERRLVDGEGFDVSKVDQKLVCAISQDQFIQGVLARREPTRINDTSGRKGWDQTPSIRSWIGVPLVYRGSRVGLITFDHDQVGAFSHVDLPALGVLAAEAAASLYKAWRFDEAQRHIENLGLMRDVGEQILAAEEVTAVMELIVKGVVSLLAVDASTIYLGELDGERVRVTERFGWPEPVSVRLPDPRPGGLTSTIMRDGKTIYQPDFEGSDRFNEALRYHSRIGVALRTTGRIEGVLYLFTKLQRRFTETEQSILESLANHAALVIQKTRRLEDIERKKAAADRLLVFSHFTTDFFHSLQAPINSIDSLGTLASASLDDGAKLHQELRGDPSKTVLLDELGSLQARARDRLGEVCVLTKSIIVNIQRVIDTMTQFSATAPVLVQPICDVLDKACKSVGRNGSRCGPMLDRVLRVEFKTCTLDVESYQLTADALACLIENAMEAVEHRQDGRVTVAAELASDGREVLVRVVDNGRGIPSNIQKQLFALRASSKPHGIGCGLYFAKAVFEVAGITLTHETSPERGTTFFVRIPRPKRAAGKEANPS
jgi:GAF domain-containing protein